MQNEAITSTSVAITGTSIGSMIIFNDPIYLYLAYISGFAGLLSALNDLDELKKLTLNFYTFFVAFKGAFIGFFSAPLVMVMLVVFGDQLAKKIGFTIEKNNMYLISLYWLLSILFSRLITQNILKYLEEKLYNAK